MRPRRCSSSMVRRSDSSKSLASPSLPRRYRGLRSRRVKIVAGKGAAGQAGVDGMKDFDGSAAAPQQQGAPADCSLSASDTQLGGRWTGMSGCGSLGGNGGVAVKGVNGTPGVAGTPNMNVEPPNVNQVPTATRDRAAVATARATRAVPASARAAVQEAWAGCPLYQLFDQVVFQYWNGPNSEGG